MTDIKCSDCKHWRDGGNCNILRGQWPRDFFCGYFRKGDIECLDCKHWIYGNCNILHRQTEGNFFCKGFQKKDYFRVVHKPGPFMSHASWCIEFHDGCVTEVCDLARRSRREQLTPLVRWLNEKILPYLLEKNHQVDT